MAIASSKICNNDRGGSPFGREMARMLCRMDRKRSSWPLLFPGHDRVRPRTGVELGGAVSLLFGGMVGLVLQRDSSKALFWIFGCRGKIMPGKLCAIGGVSGSNCRLPSLPEGFERA